MAAYIWNGLFAAVGLLVAGHGIRELRRPGGTGWDRGLDAGTFFHPSAIAAYGLWMFFHQIEKLFLELKHPLLARVANVGLSAAFIAAGVLLVLAYKRRLPRFLQTDSERSNREYSRPRRTVSEARRRGNGNS